MSKKILSILLIAILSLSLVACGDSGSNVTSTTSTDAAVDTTAAEQSANSSEVTVETLKSAPVTAESDFSYEVIDGQMTITDYSGSDEIVVIPDTIEGQKVVAIDNFAFANNEVIKGVKLSDGIISVGNNVFENCHSLKIFVCGINVETIGELAFNFCDSLKEVELNEGLKSIGLLCFTATAIERIYIPESVESITMAFLETESGEAFVIEGKAGSYAEQYAKDNNHNFEAV